jgi:hypothetical protein
MKRDRIFLCIFDRHSRQKKFLKNKMQHSRALAVAGIAAAAAVGVWVWIKYRLPKRKPKKVGDLHHPGPRDKFLVETERPSSFFFAQASLSYTYR